MTTVVVMIWIMFALILLAIRETVNFADWVIKKTKDFMESRKNGNETEEETVPE